MTEKKFEAVFIDWNGTLSTHRFWEHLSDPTHPHHEIFLQAEDILFGGSEFNHIFRPWMTGELTTEEVLYQFSKATGLSYNILLSELETSCKIMQLVSPEVDELVQQIRQEGTKVVIATDNMDTFNRWTIPALQLNETFDAILNSYDLKALKKDPPIDGVSPFFGRFLNEQAINPANTIIIDDSEDKGNMIQSYGIKYKRVEFGMGLIPTLEEILLAGAGS